MHKARLVWEAWFAERPTARAVVLFSALNIMPVLLFTLVFPPFRAGKHPVPLTDPAAITVRLVMTGLTMALIIWTYRPGHRRGGELWWLAGATLVLLALYAPFYSLLFLLAIVPLLLRGWISFSRTLLITALLCIPLTGLDALLNHTLNSQALPDLKHWLSLLPWLVAFALVVNLYTLVAFEFAYREALMRHNLAALSEVHREFASLSERGRISRELHDTIGHHLMITKLHLQVLARQQLPAEAQAALSTLEDSNAAAVRELREVVRVLRPLGGESSLVAALRKLLEQPQVTFTVRGNEFPLSEAQRLTLYRAAQESLSNAIKHAPGAPLHIELRFTADQVCLDASNNTPLSLGDPAGLGLVGLRERVTELGGQFKAGRHGRQFQLAVRLPT